MCCTCHPGVRRSRPSSWAGTVHLALAASIDSVLRVRTPTASCGGAHASTRRLESYQPPYSASSTSGTPRFDSSRERSATCPRRRMDTVASCEVPRLARIRRCLVAHRDLATPYRASSPCRTVHVTVVVLLCNVIAGLCVLAQPESDQCVVVEVQHRTTTAAPLPQASPSRSAARRRTARTASSRASRPGSRCPDARENARVQPHRV